MLGCSAELMDVSSCVFCVDFKGIEMFVTESLVIAVALVNTICTAALGQLVKWALGLAYVCVHIHKSMDHNNSHLKWS